MLLQHSNYLAIKAAQKPHYGLSWGLVGLGHIRCAHSSSVFEPGYQAHYHSRSSFFFLCSNLHPGSLIMLNYCLIEIKFWLTLWSFEAFAGILQQAPGQCWKFVSHRVWFVTHTSLSCGICWHIENAQRSVTRTCVIPYTLITAAMTSETGSHFDILYRSALLQPASLAEWKKGLRSLCEMSIK